MLLLSKDQVWVSFCGLIFEAAAHFCPMPYALNHRLSCAGIRCATSVLVECAVTLQTISRCWTAPACPALYEFP